MDKWSFSLPLRVNPHSKTLQILYSFRERNRNRVLKREKVEHGVVVVKVKVVQFLLISRHLGYFFLSFSCIFLLSFLYYNK